MRSPCDRTTLAGVEVWLMIKQRQIKTECKMTPLEHFLTTTLKIQTKISSVIS